MTMTAAGDEVSPAPVFLGANPACVALEVETRVNSSNSPDTPRAMQKHTFSTTGKHPCNEIQVSENRRWVAFGRWGPGRGGPQHRLDKPLDVKREIPCHCWWFPRSPGMVRGMHTANMASSSDPLADDRPSSPVWQQVDTLEVTQIVLAILEARKTMPWATAATVSRERHGDEFHISVTLLRSSPSMSRDHREGHGDASGAGEVVAAFTVRQLGEDLACAFGDRDVITLK